MNRLFIFEQIKNVEMGGAFENGKQPDMALCPIHDSVREILVEMLTATKKEMHDLTPIPGEFEPASKYSGKEHLAIDLNVDYLVELKNCLEATNIRFQQQRFKDPDKLLWYFARFTDVDSKVCFAVRRATYFKGTAKENRMLALTGDDSLRLFKDRLFRLDPSFDFLVYDNEVQILYPGSFVYICDLDRLLQMSVADQAKAIEKEIPFLNLSTAVDRGKDKKRTAQLFACVRRRKDLNRISESLFEKACKDGKVELVRGPDGRLLPARGSEDNFLRILDRRRFWIEIIENERELYNADSRTRDD